MIKDYAIPSLVSGNVLPRSVRSNDVNKGPFGSVRQVPCLDPFSNLSSTEANTINLYSQIIPEFEFPICAGLKFKPANDETTSCGMMTANYKSISTAAGLPIITGECCVSDVIGFTRTERITYMRFSLNKPNINMPKNGTINVGQTAECGATENDGKRRKLRDFEKAIVKMNVVISNKPAKIWELEIIRSKKFNIFIFPIKLVLIKFHSREAFKK